MRQLFSSRAIKGATKDHPLIGIGVFLYMATGVSMSLLDNWYAELDQVPVLLQILLVCTMLASFFITAIGGFLYIGKRNKASGAKEHVVTFVQGFLHEAKIPFLIIIVSMIGIFTYVYLTEGIQF